MNEFVDSKKICSDIGIKVYRYWDKMIIWAADISTHTNLSEGVDVIATKNGFKYGIQAKCYSGQVGNSAIQEVVAGKTYYSLNKAIVVTNNFFTKSAIKLAEANGVVLWDRNILKEKLVYLNQ